MRRDKRLHKPIDLTVLGFLMRLMPGTETKLLRCYVVRYANIGRSPEHIKARNTEASYLAKVTLRQAVAQGLIGCKEEMTKDGTKVRRRTYFRLPKKSTKE